MSEPAGVSPVFSSLQEMKMTLPLEKVKMGTAIREIHHRQSGVLRQAGRPA